MDKKIMWPKTFEPGSGIFSGPFNEDGKGGFEATRTGGTGTPRSDGPYAGGGNVWPTF